MKAQVIEKAPQPLSKEAPKTAVSRQENYTIWGTRSGTKPDYLIKAELATSQALLDYDWLINAGITHEGALTEAWDVFTAAERERREAWKAYQDGLDFIPCEF